MRSNHALLSLAAGLLLTGGAALAQTPAASAPPPACRDDPLFRQQDYILGTWDVFNKDRQSAQVTMERVLNDCTIRETWTPVGRPNGHGIGLMTYSRLQKAWNYFWVADSGATTYFKGALNQPGEMQYATTAPLPGGGEKLRRWTLYSLPEGGIHEVSVGSDDGGKTWTPEYDLVWRKAK